MNSSLSLPGRQSDLKRLPWGAVAVPGPLNGCGSKGGDLGVAEVGPPGAGLAPKSHFSNVCCTLATSPVRGKEALPVIPVQFSSRTGGNRQLLRVAGWTTMDCQRLPLPLFLLFLTGQSFFTGSVAGERQLWGSFCWSAHPAFCSHSGQRLDIALALDRLFVVGRLVPL